jgi:hypothetical protein
VGQVNYDIIIWLTGICYTFSFRVVTVRHTLTPYRCASEKLFDPEFTPSQAAWTHTLATAEPKRGSARINTPTASNSGASTSAITPPTRSGSMSGLTPSAGKGEQDSNEQGGRTDFMFGVDTSDWFDISSYSFDADVLLAMIPDGAMFEGSASFGLRS